MKSHLAHALLLLGVLCLASSCAPFGWVFYNEFLVSPGQSYEVFREQGETQLELSSEPGTLARVGLRADVNTPSVQEDSESLDEEYKARFRFPLNYQVSGSDGAIILEDKTQLAWKDGASISTSDQDIDSTGGTLTVSTRLKKFEVPADGRMLVNIGIGEDRTYLATLSSAAIELHENLVDNSSYLVIGMLLVASGLILLAIGFFKLIYDAAKQQEGSEHSEGISSDPDVNQQAMMIHLAGFAGYVFPFGSLLLPLLLWLLWRKRDPYLDSAGKEALNFQISVHLYYFLAVILMLVVIGIVLFVGLMFYQLAAIIIAAIHASRGEDFRYPLTIRLIK